MGMKLNLLIVGGGSSLGLGLAKQMVVEGHNLCLITGKKNVNLVPSKNVKVISNKLENSDDVKEVCVDILKEFDSFDVIFYNIGGGLGMSDTMISFNDLNKVLWFNFGVIQEFNRLMIPKIKPSGKIICIGSIATRQLIGSLGYTIAKTALETYVRFLGKELISKKISIMALSIGAYWEKGNAMDRLKRNKPAFYNDFIEKRLPRKKMATTEEIIPFISHFCMIDTSILSGSIIPMDGAENISL